MLTALLTLLATLSSIFRSRAALELENLALRHQIGVLRKGAAKRLKLTSADRLLWALRETQGKLSGPTGAATKLGLPRQTLESKIKRLGIKRYRFKIS
jgi:transcriptional regulator with GAF, ATPase, and Fis domain